jgi:hypothetical protein
MIVLLLLNLVYSQVSFDAREVWKDLMQVKDEGKCSWGSWVRI